MDPAVEQKMMALKAQMQSRFNDDDIKEFIRTGKEIASKTVLTAVMRVIEEGPGKNLDAGIAASLVKKISKLMPYNHVAPMQHTFTETPYRLHISLSIVPKDYKSEIDIPDEKYGPMIIEDCKFLKSTAIAYWRQFAEDNKDLYEKICKYRPDIDFTNLVIDPKNPTTMYFDPECKFRVGIFFYYTDPNGNAIKKK